MAVKAGFRKSTPTVAGFINKVGADLKIAFLAFNKHISQEIQSRLAAKGPRVEKGSQEQEAIWAEALNGSRHIQVNAVAGSGKTTTGMEYCFRSGGRVDAMTYHGLGFKILKQAFGSVDVDQYKTHNIVDKLGLLSSVPDKEQRLVKSRLVHVVSLAKQYGRYTKADLEWMIETHDVDLTTWQDLVVASVSKVLDQCRKHTATVDFDDMVWLPVDLGLKPKWPWDVIITDEAQDLNVIQQQLALSAGERHIVVGDSKQAIYLFRGADSKSMERMREQLAQTDRGVVDLPLTITRRCPKLHTRMAQRLVPQITALDDAPEGVVRVAKMTEALDQMKPGDMVLCRVNAPLLSTAYRLLKRGTKAIVRGREIGQGIIGLIDQACKRAGLFGQTMDARELVEVAGEITFEKVNVFMAMPHGRGEMRASAIQDMYECLVAMCDGCKTSTDVKTRVNSLFNDDEGQALKESVVLSTIHRGKGMEATRVWVLEPQLIPHPMAKKAEDMQVENNAAYICVTRVKFTKETQGELVWVGKECGLFAGVEEQTVDTSSPTGRFPTQPAIQDFPPKPGTGGVDLAKYAEKDLFPNQPKAEVFSATVTEDLRLPRGWHRTKKSNDGGGE